MMMQVIAEKYAAPFSHEILFSRANFGCLLKIENVSEKTQCFKENAKWTSQEFYNYSPYGSRIQLKTTHGELLKNKLLAPDDWFPLSPTFLWDERVDLKTHEEKLLESHAFVEYPIELKCFFAEVFRLDAGFDELLSGGFLFRLKVPILFQKVVLESDWVECQYSLR